MQSSIWRTDWEKGTPATHVEAAARSCGDRLQRYVFVSSVAAYPPGLGLRESDALVPDDVPDLYALHKASAERLLFGMHQASGSPSSRSARHLSTGRGSRSTGSSSSGTGCSTGVRSCCRTAASAPTQWVFVDDVATACLRAIEVPEAVGEAFNIGHVEPLTQRTFVEALARVAGIEPRFVSVPRATIRAAGGQLIGGSIYFGDYLDLPPRTSLVEKAARVLDVTPTPLEAASAEAWRGTGRSPRRPVDYTFEDRLIAEA